MLLTPDMWDPLVAADIDGVMPPKIGQLSQEIIDDFNALEPFDYPYDYSGVITHPLLKKAKREFIGALVRLTDAQACAGVVIDIEHKRTGSGLYTRPQGRQVIRQWHNDALRVAPGNFRHQPIVFAILGKPRAETLIGPTRLLGNTFGRALNDAKPEPLDEGGVYLHTRRGLHRLPRPLDEPSNRANFKAHVHLRHFKA